MTKIVECVPNFSEGRRAEVVEEIVKAVREVKGTKIIGYSLDPDHNRAVLTFIGELEPVKEAAFRACKKAVDLINMEEHSGQHPRIGACDVIPFVPIMNVEMKECVKMAEETAERIWNELGVPTYLYAEAARLPERKKLPNIRKGDYEGLKVEISKPERHPDYGEPRLHPTAGATVVGARFPLIAYNINLGTSDLEVAKKVAKAVRESSGGLMNVQARGMMMQSRGLAQVSLNLLDYRSTPLYRVFELVKMEAARYGVNVVSSEVIELLPLDAVTDVFTHYLRIDGFARDQILEEKLWGD